MPLYVFLKHISHVKLEIYVVVFCQINLIHCAIFIYVNWKYNSYSLKDDDQGPVVQSVVSLTSSLRVISLTVLVDSIHNILIFFAEKM